MNITAVLAIRNEEVYLANCLRHLVRNGINFVIIDNASVDTSADIYRRREFAPYLVDVQELPFSGVFSLSDQLKRKMAAIDTLDSDWILHIDADEVMHSFHDGESLNEAISRLDAENWNAITFDELVFLPLDHDYVPDIPGPQPLLHYYFFQPSSPRLMRAWKKASGFSLVEQAGHLLTGSGIRLAPEHLALRHYIMRSQEHAFQKYTSRKFAANEVVWGWHANRANQPVEAFKFPPTQWLRKLAAADHRKLDLSDPWVVHYWQRSLSLNKTISI